MIAVVADRGAGDGAEDGPDRLRIAAVVGIVDHDLSGLNRDDLDRPHFLGAVDGARIVDVGAVLMTAVGGASGDEHGAHEKGQGKNFVAHGCFPSSLGTGFVNGENALPTLVQRR